MFSKTVRAALVGSSAALLVAIVPLRNSAVQEFAVLKRIAEDRIALSGASRLPTDSLPRSAGVEGSPRVLSPSPVQPVMDVSTIEVPASPETLPAAPEA